MASSQNEELDLRNTGFQCPWGGRHQRVPWRHQQFLSCKDSLQGVLTAPNLSQDEKDHWSIFPRLRKNNSTALSSARISQAATCRAALSGTYGQGPPSKHSSFNYSCSCARHMAFYLQFKCHQLLFPYCSFPKLVLSPHFNILS